MSLVLCPKCQQKNWSQDYFVCSNCGYEESRKWVLLEENKDFSENRSRGDNPALNLNFWMEEQKKLAQEITDRVLPSQKVKVRIKGDLAKRGCWGESHYRTPLRARANFIIKKLVDHYYGKKIDKSRPDLIAEKKRIFKHFFHFDVFGILINWKYF